MQTRRSLTVPAAAVAALILFAIILVAALSTRILNAFEVHAALQVLPSQPPSLPSDQAHVGTSDAPTPVLSDRLKEQMDRDLTEVTVAQLQNFYAQRKYSVRDVVSWYLNRIADLNPKFRPFVYVYGKEALARADREDTVARQGKPAGTLWGVPIIIKGSTCIAGKITASGWEGYARPHLEFIATRNATIVEKLQQAGAIVLGHANMPDLGKSDTNVSSLGGRTGNAYNHDFSPGGSSGGVAVAVALNLAVIGQGSDTGNSIRNPSSNASVVGVFPTEGLVSVAGIHPYDPLLDNTGPIARTVRDAALALDTMSGKDPDDPRTAHSVPHKGKRSYTEFLKTNALKGRRFGVPKFILDGSPALYPNETYYHRGVSPPTRAIFMQAVQKLRAAGATIVFDDDLLTEKFALKADSFQTKPYRERAIDRFLNIYAPEQINSLAKLNQQGIELPVERFTDGVAQTTIESDPKAASNYYEPRRQLIEMYRSTLRKYRLDGFVYPALQVPPNDERNPLPKDYPTDGPYSFSNWVNRLGTPSVVVPAGYYANGLPFGIEFSADFWKDGDLLGYAYAFEQSTHVRHAPVPR